MILWNPYFRSVTFSAFSQTKIKLFLYPMWGHKKGLGKTKNKKQNKKLVSKKSRKIKSPLYY